MIPTTNTNRIDQRFAELKKHARAGLIPFVTAGDPHPDYTVAVMHALVAAGADLIELGVPFSDPMADGPVIQHANERALLKGIGLKNILGWVEEFRRKDVQTPIVLMGYLNPIEIYGYARFADDAANAGVDGVLLVDCPVEEVDAAQTLRARGLRQIFLAAPTTDTKRLHELCDHAEGFVYYVSFAGITGASHLDLEPVKARVAAIKARTNTPVAVGFGIKDAASAASVSAFADAVVIGSALVETLAGSSSADEAARRASDFLAPIRAVLDALRTSNAA